MQIKKSNHSWTGSYSKDTGLWTTYQKDTLEPRGFLFSQSGNQVNQITNIGFDFSITAKMLSQNDVMFKI